MLKKSFRGESASEFFKAKGIASPHRGFDAAEDWNYFYVYDQMLFEGLVMGRRIPGRRRYAGYEQDYEQYLEV